MEISNTKGKYISMIVLGSKPGGTDMSVQLLAARRQKLTPTSLFLFFAFLPPQSFATLTTTNVSKKKL